MKDAKKDFESFMNGGEQSAGSSHVLHRIHQEIAKTAPKTTSVAVKLDLIHLVSSCLTLMACPQFGTRLFFKGDGLMHWFMEISPLFCMSFCGAFYLSVTFLLARWTLKYDEWLVITRSRTLSIGVLALLSLGTFAMLARGISLEAGVFWLFGATLAAEAASASRQTYKKIFAFNKN